MVSSDPGQLVAIRHCTLAEPFLSEARRGIGEQAAAVLPAAPTTELRIKFLRFTLDSSPALPYSAVLLPNPTGKYFHPLKMQQNFVLQNGVVA
jgi:hypothetical protein